MIIVLMLAGGVFGYCLLKCIRNMREATARFEAWAKRDDELNQRFLHALDEHDYVQCDRIRYAISKNLEGWKEG